METGHSKISIALSAGGTGGHIFPAEALAEELVFRGYHVAFFTDERSRKYLSGQKPYEIIYVSSHSLSGSIVDRIKGLRGLMKGFKESMQHLSRLNCKAAVGFGGYPSFPPIYAAQILRKPTIIHEQNSILGKANRTLAKKAKVIATAFPSVKGINDAMLPKVKLVGNPVRKTIEKLYTQAYVAPEDEGVFNLLITGGSQGASAFSTVIPEALAALPEAAKKRLSIVQQCREAELEGVKKLYQQLGLKAELKTFFSDMDARYSAAHLVISRAGASTVAELSVAGRPAIFIPFPLATDGHQKINADAVEDAGGGWVMEEKHLTAQALTIKLAGLMITPAELVATSENIRKLAPIDAGKKLADVVESLIK